MKVALITGPREPGKCGVGDYTALLAAALQEHGVQAEIVSGGNWRLAWLPSLVRLVRRAGADIVHLQYPSAGFGQKLGPQGLAMAVPTVVTVHEASNSHLLRKMSMYPFTLRARHMIFTTHEERAFAVRWAPWIRARSSVIPIGSNIETGQPCAEREIDEIVYFGLVMPYKGLDDVLALAALLGRKGCHLRLRIIGGHRPEHAAYADELRRKSKGLPVVWEEDLPGIEVGRRLASAAIAYLPFPDGATERRTTLKAALANGMVVVTTRGKCTPREFEPVVQFAASPLEAYQVISELAASPSRTKELGDQAKIFAEKYSWKAIVQSHIDLYQRLAPYAWGWPDRDIREQIIA